jgi:hypothetical protein
MGADLPLIHLFSRPPAPRAAAAGCPRWPRQRLDAAFMAGPDVPTG